MFIEYIKKTVIKIFWKNYVKSEWVVEEDIGARSRSRSRSRWQRPGLEIGGGGKGSHKSVSLITRWILAEKKEQRKKTRKIGRVGESVVKKGKKRGIWRVFLLHWIPIIYLRSRLCF